MQYDEDKDATSHFDGENTMRHEHSRKYLHTAIIDQNDKPNKKQSKFVLDDPTMQYEKDKAIHHTCGEIPSIMHASSNNTHCNHRQNVKPKQKTKQICVRRSNHAIRQR